MDFIGNKEKMKNNMVEQLDVSESERLQATDSRIE